jgi:hypothetical protein
MTSLAASSGNAVSGPDVGRCVSNESTTAQPIDPRPAEEKAMTPTITPPPEAAAPPVPEEPCDRCNAAGKLRLVLAGGGDLVFCGHHANKYAPELVKIAVQVVSAPDFTWLTPRSQ